MAYDYEATDHPYPLVDRGIKEIEAKVRNREILPNLKAQRQELVMRIEKIDKLIILLEKNPDFVRFHDLMRELI